MIKKLIEFEEKSGVLDFTYKFNNEAVWPYIRVMLYEKINRTYNKLESYRMNNISSEESFFKMNFLKNPFFEKQHDIVFLQSQSGLLIPKGNKYFNKLVDYYVDMYSNKTLMIEFKSINKYKFNRTFDNIKYMDFIDNLVNSEYMVKKKEIDPEDLVMASQMINSIKKWSFVNIDEGFYSGLEKYILTLSQKIQIYYKYYENLLEILKPKVLFMDNGCYGGIYSLLIKIANLKGIVTAEFQHGNTNNNYAYNMSEKLINDENLKMYFPKYFLTMGEHWKENIKLPCKIKTIGNPYLYSRANELNTKKSDKMKNNILVISDWLYKDMYVKFIEEFLKVDIEKKYNIILRLHPADDKNLNIYSELKEKYKIEISEISDVYDDIGRSDIIVGCYSTVMYECVPFNKRIFIIDNPRSRLYVDPKLGTWIANGSSLFKCLEENRIKHIEENIEYYWDSNWKNNYIDFIENIVYKKCDKIN